MGSRAVIEENSSLRVAFRSSGLIRVWLLGVCDGRLSDGSVQVVVRRWLYLQNIFTVSRRTVNNPPSRLGARTKDADQRAKITGAARHSQLAPTIA